MRKKVISLLFLLLWNCLSAVQLKEIDTVILSGGGGDDFIKVPAAFVITEDGYYIVTDRKESDLKVFDLKGTFIRRIGRKGSGPNEHLSPGRCDYFNQHLILEDLDKRQFTLMSRDKVLFLKESKILRSMYMGSDVAFMGHNKVLIEGFGADRNRKEWEGYIYDFQTKAYHYLLPRATKFGVSSVNEIEKISQLGLRGCCNWYGDYAYLVWSGDLKIFKINMKTKQISTFGTKTPNYAQPRLTEALLKAKRERNFDKLSQELMKNSFVVGISTNAHYVVLTYDRALGKGESVPQRMAQFYTLDGIFINELVINPAGYGTVFLSKDLNDDILYMLSRAPEKESDEDDVWQISRYKMIK